MVAFGDINPSSPNKVFNEKKETHVLRLYESRRSSLYACGRGRSTIPIKSSRWHISQAIEIKTTANIVCIASTMNREDSENGIGILFSTVNTSNMRNRPFSKSFLFQSEPEWKDFFTKSESILIHIESPTNYRHKIFRTWTRLQIETEGNSEMTYSWVNSASSACETNILHHLLLILLEAGVFSTLSARE